ncbi:MAG: methionine aminotransferase [Cytophagales bacterium]|nr:methionine aminotransferase [Cytophagales bacterium]
MTPIASKFPHLGISIFPEMSTLAQKHHAINLAQGFPGFPVDSALIDLVYKYMKEGFNQYSPMPGVMRLREVLAEKQKKCYGLKYIPISEVTIAGGATEAVFSTLSAFIHAGDEVIQFEPVFDIYPPAIELNHGKTVRIKLSQPDFSYDWDLVRKAITPKTKMIIVNTPHNPAGTVLTLEDINQLAEIVRGTNILLLSDEVYEHMTFVGRTHVSPASHPELYDRTIITASLGKVFHCTGWRIGYCLAPASLSVEIRKVHQFVTFSANTSIQYAMADYLEIESNYLDLNDFFQKKRDLFTTKMAKSRFDLLPVQGSYFQLASYKRISNQNDVEFAKWLTAEHKVATIPISVFYSDHQDDHLIRFCFAKEESELEAAAERLFSI